MDEFDAVYADSGGDEFDQVYGSEPAYAFIPPTPWQAAEFTGKATLKGAAGLADVATSAVLDALKSPYNVAKTAITGEIEKPVSVSPFSSVVDYFGMNPETVGLQKRPEDTYDVTKIVPAVMQGALIPGGQVMNAASSATSEIARQAFPDSTIAPILGAFGPMGVKTAAQSLFSAAKNAPSLVSEMFNLDKKALNDVRKLAPVIRDVSPGFAVDSISPAERTLAVAKGLDAKALGARKTIGAMFERLPDEVVVLDDAIKNTAKFAEDKGALLAPGGTANSVVKAISALTPEEQIIRTPASVIVDEFGAPLREATERTIKTSATATLPETQNILRDIGKAGERTAGVDKLIVGEANRQVLKAAEQSVSPEAFSALTKARDAWKNMTNTFDKGAVNKVREIVTKPDAPFERLKNVLFKEKAAQQLASVMNPSEISHAQQLMLGKLFSGAPSSWEKTLITHRGAFSKIFNEQNTDNLIKLVSKDGTIGKKLLTDTGALKAATNFVLNKVGLRWMDHLAPETSRAQALLMRAAAGDKELLKILSAPAKESTYKSAVSAISKRLQQNMPVTPFLQSKQESPAPKNDLFEGLFSMPEKKEDIEAKILANPTDAAIYEMESASGKKLKNPTSSAKGAFQLIDSTAKKLGVKNVMDLEDNYNGYLKLKQENIDRFGTDDPELVYSAHYLGAPLLEKVLQKKPLSPREQVIVDGWERLVMPRFRRVYSKILEKQKTLSV